MLVLNKVVHFLCCCYHLTSVSRTLILRVTRQFAATNQLQVSQVAEWSARGLDKMRTERFVDWSTWLRQPDISYSWVVQLLKTFLFW